MDIDELKKLIKLVEKSRVGEIEIEEDGKRVRISKLGMEVPVPAVAQSYVVPPPPPSPLPEHPHARPGREEKKEEDKDDGNLHSIKSPMVGTFYRAPAEDAEPFVKEGDIVQKGQTLCIIEAMKLMNEIESDVKGRVVRILPENGSPVEYGEVLFKIDPQ